MGAELLFASIEIDGQTDRHVEGKKVFLILILILKYLLTTIGVTPGGSSTVHIYTKSIHRTIQYNNIPRTEHI